MLLVSLLVVMYSMALGLFGDRLLALHQQLHSMSRPKVHILIVLPSLPVKKTALDKGFGDYKCVQLDASQFVDKVM